MFQNLELLQILQVVLFVIPIASLLTLGLAILLRRVTVLNRRWMLLVYLPILLDNLLAIFGNSVYSMTDLLSYRSFWLVLVVDVVLTVGITLVMKGYAVFGVTPEQVQETLVQALQADGFTITLDKGLWKSYLGQPTEAEVIRWEREGESGVVYLTSRAGEVLLRGKTRKELAILHITIEQVRRIESPYDFSQHAAGVLYLVMAVVLAVFGWIYFFEPRLILIE